VLLAVDVGNTQTVFGLYDGDRLAEHWRVSTEAERTGDELGVLVGRLLELRDLGFEDIAGVCLSSTVPPLVRAYEDFARDYAEARLLVVGPGTRTGIPIVYDDPREVGPDRIANAVAARERYGAPCIVVDFGTSTNFDIVSPAGEYVGGVLAPGIEVSMEALFARAARLVKVDFAPPPSVIGKTTVAGLQSGLVYGFAGQVDGIVERGQAVIDESALTGEPLPVTYAQGGTVKSGTANAGEAFEARAVRPAAESAYAALVRLVEQAETQRAPFVRLADRYAIVFLPVTVVVAGIAWTLSGDAIRALGMRFNAGHALTYFNVEPVAKLSGLRELHIGHAIVSRAVFIGMREAVREMKRLISEAAHRGALQR